MTDKAAQTRNNQRKAELLAPAGGLPAFFAALEAGADAVYCGLTSFSARAKAKNFTPAEIGQMTNYAHQHGKKIYVALNTLVKEAELALLVETLADLDEAGVDGLIIQDLAVWRLVRRHFPELPLHASTQMTVHNAAGVNRLAAMGFRRAVLARELTLAEIGAIGREAAIDLEHFVHGALCFSISGQCLFSSFLTGRSGNRGRCVQPCRRRVSWQNRPGYHFSTSDFCALDHLPQLLEAGVTSFKIEGRMKSAEYVGRVVTAYRMVMDAPAGERQRIMQVARKELELSFGRKTTSGFLSTNLPAGIVAPSEKGTIGQHLGQISSVRGKTIFIELGDKLHLGDRLKVMPRNDQPGAGLTVISMKVNGRAVKAARSGAIVGVETAAAAKIGPGDQVYKVAAEQAFTMEEAAGRRKLSTVKPPTHPLSLEIAIAGNLVTTRGTAAGITVEKTYQVESSPAVNRPLDEDILARTFVKTASHPFTLQDLKAPDLPPVIIPPSRLNEVRRDFFQHLEEAVLAEVASRRSLKRLTVTSSLLPEEPVRPRAGQHLTVSVSDIMDAAILDNPMVNRVSVPLTPENIQGLSRVSRQLAGREPALLWDVPPLIFPADWQQCKAAAEQLGELGFSSFRVNNISHFQLFNDTAAELVAGSRLYTMNSEAARAWQESGVGEVTLSIEDDRANMKAILARHSGVRVCVTIYAPFPLLISRIPVGGVKSGSLLVADQGDEYLLRNEQGITALYSARDFSLIADLAELKAMGCSRFHLDLSHCGPFSAKGREVLEALATGKDPAGTTACNFHRGLE